jgi:hypothetical protein
LPSRIKQWRENYATCQSPLGDRAFTATGIAPDLHRLPF